MQRQAASSFIESAITTEGTRLSLWRARSIALLRIAFGLIWGIDAWFKWQPGFIRSFSDQIKSAGQGQPQGVQSWIGFWTHVVGANPPFFAYLTASVEMALAVFLIFGLLTHLTCVVGFLWSVGIWAIPEGFGGPYKPGESTDIGTALLYALMFAVLFAISAGRYYGVDRWVTSRLGPLGFMASGKFGRRSQREGM